MKIIDYVTLMDKKPLELDKAVKSKIRMNWQPYGNPFIINEVTDKGTKIWLCQCLVKYAE